MTVRFFVSKDSRGLEWPPDTGHETSAAIEICRKLWLAFNNQSKLYALIANLHKPSADLVLLTEHGIGIVELKHYFGKVTVGSDSAWNAGGLRMKAGSTNQGFINPHQQVQKYADDIRKKLINISGKNWLPGRKIDWPLFKFQTAVCFTHPEVYIDPFRDFVRKNNPLMLHPWEEFRLLLPEDIPTWAAAIRFEVNKGFQEDFEPNRFSPQTIISIAKDLLNSKEWSEISNLMPSGDPFGYLIFIENGQRTQIIPLDHDKILIGRNQQTCSVIIPNTYSEASRKHCQIIRTAEGIFIEDLKSTNGTFLDGLKIQKQKLDCSEHKITIGGPLGSNKICEFDFKIRDQSEPTIPSTFHKDSESSSSI